MALVSSGWKPVSYSAMSSTASSSSLLETEEGAVGGGVGQHQPQVSALTCGVCMSFFDATFRRPLILTGCGHTFCRVCVKDLSLRGPVVCPSCRHRYDDVDPDMLPINFNIQCLATAGVVVPTALVLPKDEGSSSQCSQHDVRLAFWCSNCEEAVCGECLYDQHPRPSHPVCRLTDVIAQVKQRAETLAKDNCELVVVRLGQALRRALLDVSDVQEAAHLLQETARVNVKAAAAHDMSTITDAFELAKALAARVDALDRGPDNRDQPIMPPEVPLSMRPAVLALSETGGLAKVRVEEKGIHVYSLQPSSTAYSVAIKLNVLKASVSKDSPMTFLDIKAGERRFGRVYVRLNGSMRRAHQFMALCLGSLGPCYRGTRFDGVNERGQPGEYLRGGDYQHRQGLGGEALMDNLEWGDRWRQPKAAGQVCGVGGEESKRFGSLFAICLRNNPDDTFQAPFGMVTQGLDVLEVACRHDPFNLVHIADCGIVIPC